MFKKAKNINEAFHYIRGFTFVIVIASMLISLFAIYKSYTMVVRSQGRVYVLASGKVLEAFASERKDNLAVEAKDHLRVFHEYFFKLDPDDKSIQASITKALYLADGSAKRAYDDLRENSYYAGLISGNVSQTIMIDSISLDMGSYPFAFKCFCTQQIIRPTTISTRNLITQGYLRDISRSENNPHGFLIERWQIIENKDLKTTNR